MWALQENHKREVKPGRHVGMHLWPRTQHAEVGLQSVLLKSESLKIEGLKGEMGGREKKKKEKEGKLVRVTGKWLTSLVNTKLEKFQVLVLWDNVAISTLLVSQWATMARFSDYLIPTSFLQINDIQASRQVEGGSVLLLESSKEWDCRTHLSGGGSASRTWRNHSGLGG